MPTTSRRRRRRLSASSVGPASARGAVTETLSKEGLAANPVADDVEGVEIAGVAGRVQEASTARGRALPDPPAGVVIERGCLGPDLRPERLVALDERLDARGPSRLGLARVGVALADVRRHARAPPMAARTWSTGDGFV